MLELLVNRFIYYPDPYWVVKPEDLGLKGEAVWLSPEPGVRLHAWFFPQPQPFQQDPVKKPLATLLFCHGNAGNVSHRLGNVAFLLRAGFQVLLFDYRGYGASSGRPSEQGLYRDAAAAWAHLIERKDAAGVPRVIFGRSLGGAVAVELATRVQAEGLIVESTFTSLLSLARVSFPFPLPPLPVKYDSLSKIRRLQMPLLVIHGERDALIPVSEGQALFEAAPEPKAWYIIAGAGHNDTYLAGGDAYFQRLVAFVGDLASVAQLTPESV
jgi:fermentation-respiration switch protein FrsA (DUF1100 family)